MSGRRRTAALGVFVVATIGYLVWRALCTRNPDAPLYSWTFLALEAYSGLTAVIFYLITLRRDDPEPRPPTPGHRVDVFICTYNEPPELVRQTARRALALRYPHRTFICDDGRRPAMRALAAELGCDYLARADNAHFKAGNLNHALAHSDGDLVVVLDADHLVRPAFLESLVGYFDDPAVALVQTPQVFYNLDSFQHHFRAGKQQLWHEGAIFHHAMQPGAHRWNAALFVGTGAVLRRSALARIGGFATGSVTEDTFTSMRLHALGYRTVYHDEPLGYLLAPESLLQYLTQRLRWGQGSMQVLRLESPLSKPGLSLRQRLVYTSSLSSFALAIVHLAYYLAPTIYLLGGPAPLRATRVVDFVPLALHIVLDLTMFKLWLGRLARPLLAECYKFLNVYAYLRSLAGYFHGARRLRFQVTTKGRDGAGSLRLLVPQLVLLLVNVTGFGCGLLRLMNGRDTLVGALGVGLATFFAGVFAVVGALTLLYAESRIAARSEHLFSDHIPARLGGEEVAVLRANAAELRLVAPAQRRLGVGEDVRLSLALDERGPTIEVAAQVDSVEDLGAGSVARLLLRPLPAAAQDRLFDRLVERTLPRMIDALVHSWNGGATPLPPLVTGRAYMPVETSIL